MSHLKGAAIRVKGEGRAAHISDVIGVDHGPLQLGKEQWAMMQEDRDVVSGRSGIYFGRKEGEGEDGHAVKEVQDAVALLKGIACKCEVVKTKNDPSTAAVVMTVGAHQDGYWTCDRMCAQLPGIFAIMELTSEPYRQGVVIFDNSTGHGAYDDDALLPQNINMAPGGEKVAFAPFEDDNGKKVHPTFQIGDTSLVRKKIFLPKTAEQKKSKRKNGTALDKISAGTVIEKDGPSSVLVGVPKGAEQLLKEMDLWQLQGEKKGPVLCCKQCAGENRATRQAITAFNRGGEGREQALERARVEQQNPAGVGAPTSTVERRRCCVRKILSELTAFKGVLNKVEQMFKKAGHLCIFLPKYHPELNAIERYCGYLKYLLRLHCEYSLPHMLKILPGAMSGVPVGHIRAWSRVTWLYINAYKHGLVEYLKDRDLKKWGTHREATARGDAVVEARGAEQTAVDKRAAEAIALAAAQECRTSSIRQSTTAFTKWRENASEKDVPVMIEGPD
ncbi:unnamed protein product [Scytosiphon promiscuus]